MVVLFPFSAAEPSKLQESGAEGETPEENMITFSEGNKQEDDCWKRFPIVGKALEDPIVPLGAYL